MISSFKFNSVHISLNVDSPINCNLLKGLSYGLTLLLGLSIILNILLLVALYKCKTQKNQQNDFYLMAITILNIFGSVIVFPFLIISTFNCRWHLYGWEKSGCLISGFTMFFIGCTNCYLLIFISRENYHMIKSVKQKETFVWRKFLRNILFCAVLGLFWSTMPLLDWSHYSLAKSRISCSVEWEEQSFNVTSFNVSLFTFVFIIPMILIVFFNVKLILLIKAQNSSTKISRQTGMSKKRDNLMKRVTIRNMTLICNFIMTWSPYALVSMYSAFINSDDISPELSLITALLTKVSFTFMAFIFILFDKRVQKTLYQTLSCKIEDKEQSIKNTHNKFTSDIGTIVMVNQEKSADLSAL